MEWTVTLSKKARKNIRLLPKRVRKTLAYLIRELELTGPIKGNWPNYSKLGRARHHCHLKKGNLTYVAVWEVKDRKIRIVEVVYVGSREKAPY
jgi:mRNA-degrading endonuclease RelE of RelBE toxin-antitoxin system